MPVQVGTCTDRMGHKGDITTLDLGPPGRLSDDAGITNTFNLMYHRIYSIYTIIYMIHQIKGDCMDYKPMEAFCIASDSLEDGGRLLKLLGPS